MKPVRYVAAMRAYKWNDTIAALAARFFANCPGARHVILMNEAQGPVDCGGYETVCHTDDFRGFGLPEWPTGRSLWYNGDYACIALRTALPEYDIYIVTESDVAVNLDLEPMIQRIAARSVDAVVHRLGRVAEDWFWYPQSLAQDDPWQAGLFLGVYSGRAMDAMLTGRRALARGLMRARGAGEPELWPIIESFVPTVLREAGYRFAELGDFADVVHLRYRPYVSMLDPVASKSGSIVHPVIDGRDLIRLILEEQPASDFFRPDSIAARALSHEPLQDVTEPLFRALIAHGDHAVVGALHRMVLERGLTFPHRADLAFGKPSRVSSISEWSRGEDALLDAAGANGVVLHEVCAFHTDCEDDAWWMVDLLDECVIEQVHVVNRTTMSERFRQFAIDGSRDGERWTTRYSRLDDTPVSSDANEPCVVVFDDPFLARHVRIRRLGSPDYLHLRRVRVFGRVTRAVAD